MAVVVVGTLAGAASVAAVAEAAVVAVVGAATPAAPKVEAAADVPLLAVVDSMEGGGCVSGCVSCGCGSSSAFGWTAEGGSAGAGVEVEVETGADASVGSAEVEADAFAGIFAGTFGTCSAAGGGARADGADGADGAAAGGICAPSSATMLDIDLSSLDRAISTGRPKKATVKYGKLRKRTQPQSIIPAPRKGLC